MNTNLVNLIQLFSELRILVVGEAMLDSYLQGPTERLCREAPVPVVSVTEREHLPGGAANTALNVATLGGRVEFLSVIGDDPESRLLRKSLQAHNVSVDHFLVDKDRSTLAKQRVIAASQLVVRFDQGSTTALEAETEARLIASLRERFSQVDAVIISDYDYGILTPAVIAALAELQEKDPHLLVVDSKRLTEYQHVNATAVKPNYGEVLHLLDMQNGNGRGEQVAHGQHAVRLNLGDEHKPVIHGERLDGSVQRSQDGRVAKIAEKGEMILRRTGAYIAAVTLDVDGAVVFQRGRRPYRTYARPVPNSRAAGAGDTYVAALTLALAAGAPTETAAELASAASAVVVEKEGTAACYRDELLAFFSQVDKFVGDVFQLAAALAAYRRQEKKIVFTNGCFDILHRGHINYLNQAKAQGDILIVGLNSDDSVRRLKGLTRPINSLEDRAQVLAALSCVDHIVAFDNDTPHELIKRIEPDIFVKGGDYTRDSLPEAGLVEELGGQVKILPYLDDHSTTGIIERIRELEAVNQKGSPCG